MGLRPILSFHLGCSFEILTDHKPLIPLLGSRALDDLPPRILRFRLRLLRYSYTIQHVPGKQLIIADALSRAPLTHDPSTEFSEALQTEADAMMAATIAALPATEHRLSQLLQSQQQDPTCHLLSQYCSSGWPTRPDTAPATVQPYWPFRNSITASDNGLLLYGNRLLIPESVRQDILGRLHSGHQGIVKCRRRAQSSVWWPTISSDIERYVTNCRHCAARLSPHHEPLLSTPLPPLPWHRVASDLFQHQGRSYLLVVDYYSRFIEVAPLTSTTTSSVVQHMKSMFARHGIPDTVVTDNGPQYSSTEFSVFSTQYGFQHLTSSPLYPQANGLAERSVRTAKSLLDSTDDPYLAILAYHSTPLEHGFSPAQLLMSRQLRTNLPASPASLTPAVPPYTAVAAADASLKSRQQRNHDRRHLARPLADLQPDQPVTIRDRQEEGRVVGKAATRSYNVQTQSGVYRRNRTSINTVQHVQT